MLAAEHIVIDTPPPMVTSVSSPWAGPNGTGQAIPIKVTFSDNVYVTGTPQLALNASGGAVAVYTSGSRTNTLTFTYTVAAGQSTPDLDYTSVAALLLNGGTIVDAYSGLAATLTLPAPGPSDGLAGDFLIIDTTPPTVTGVSTTKPTGVYGSGTGILINVTFSEPVNLNGKGSSPELMLNDGSAADYSSGSGTTTLAFYYDVASGDNTPDLDYASTGALLLFGSESINDAAFNAAVLTLPATGSDGLATKNIVIDTTPPTISISAVGRGDRARSGQLHGDVCRRALQ